jgi:hypothetical protein
MSQNKSVYITKLAVNGCCVFLLGIACIVLGALHPGKCDVTDIMGLNISKYLLGLGIASVVTAVSLVICTICLMRGHLSAAVPILIISILNVVFGLSWFIVGAIILFRSNLTCIRTGSSHVIFALVLWCISAFKMCGDSREARDNSNSA